MASITPTKKKSLAERLILADKVTAGINEKAGKVVAGRIGANSEIMEKLTVRFYPTPSMAVNEIIAPDIGGFPIGRVTIVAGNSDSGKTSLMLETIALNMELDPNFLAAWIESENSLEKSYIIDTFKIDPERFIFIETDSEAGAEITIDQVEMYLKAVEPNMIVINSLKCMTPKEELEKSVASATIGLQARMNGKIMRKFTARLKEKDCSLVLICHLMTDIGSMSRDPLIVGGGRAIAFSAALTLDMRKRSIQESDPLKSEEAVKIGVSIKKNHVCPNRFPYLKTEYFAVFGEGIEQILTSLDIAIAKGIYRKGGSWIYQDNPNGGDPIRAWNGKEKFRTFMKENKDELLKLQAVIRGDMISFMSDEEVCDAVAMNEILEKAEKDIAATSDNPLVKTKKKKVIEDIPAVS